MKTAPSAPALAILVLPILLLAGCAGSPPASAPASSRGAPMVAKVTERPPAPVQKRYSQTLEGQYVLDYEVDTRYSSLDRASCYAFMTGTLTNNSDQKLSRRSAVEFHVYHGDELLFRDYTFLRTDLDTGNRVQFVLLESPLHKKQCPSYDRIDVVLKKIPIS